MAATSVTIDQTALAASLTHWWALAGVDMAVAETPCNWLNRDKAKSVPLAGQPAIAPFVPLVLSESVQPAPMEPKVVAPMPDRLAPFLEWLATDPDQPEAGFSRSRVPPMVVPGASVMIVTDMPSVEDMAQGQLFSGAERRLLAEMLRAIGHDIAQVHLASLLLARPSGGIIDDRMAEMANDRLRHLADMLRPDIAILLGDRTSRALDGTSVPMADPSQDHVNHAEGSMSVMHLPAPFVLLKHPQRKVAAWGQLRQFAVRPVQQ